MIMFSKVDDPATGGFWHRMGDLGSFDETGRLWFHGRKSHRIGRENPMFTVDCEGIFNAHPDVYRTALVGVGQGDTRKPVLCVELEKSSTHANQAELMQALQTLAGQHAHTSEINTFLFHPSFPVDIRHNAKIGREKLSIWATEQLS